MLTISRSLAPLAMIAVAVTAIAGIGSPVSAATGTPSDSPGARPLTGIGFSSELPVPGALTNRAPALTAIDFPAKKADPVIMWAGAPAGRQGDEILFAAAIKLSGPKWTRPAAVDSGSARTDEQPSAAPFGGNPAGQIIAVWKLNGSGQIMYSVGTARKGGGVTWKRAFRIPSAFTTSGPAVYSPLHSRSVFVTWRAARTNDVDVIAGVPSAAGFVSWSKVTAIPSASTTASPAVAEVNLVGGPGRLYVVWRGTGTRDQIFRAFTEDPLASPPIWSKPVAFGPRVVTATSPTAQAIGAAGGFPLLLVYRAAKGTALMYVTLSDRGAASRPLRVPHLASLDAPALYDNVLAATAPSAASAATAPSGHPIPYIRICPGCWLGDGSAGRYVSN